MPDKATPYATNAVTASLTNASETVIATLAGCMVRYPSDVFQLSGFVDLTVDASVTGITLKIRRTGIAGTTVATATVTPKAAADFARITLGIVGGDNPGDVANLTYVLTATATAAGGASTVNAASLVALGS